jgi:hypothetical protein
MATNYTNLHEKWFLIRGILTALWTDTILISPFHLVLIAQPV